VRIAGRGAKEALIKPGLMKLQFKMNEFKAKIARNSIAIAKIFNAEIIHLGCRGTNHGLISTSLDHRVRA